jgi:hypothetical protein
MPSALAISEIGFELREHAEHVEEALAARQYRLPRGIGDRQDISRP